MSTSHSPDRVNAGVFRCCFPRVQFPDPNPLVHKKWVVRDLSAAEFYQSWADVCYGRFPNLPAPRPPEARTIWDVELWTSRGLG